MDSTESTGSPPTVLGGRQLDPIHETFIRNVSHELRTPLTVLKGYAELLQMGELGELAPEQQEALFIIVNRAEELQSMIARIGTLLELEAQITLLQPLSVTGLIAQMVELWRMQAEQAGLTLRVDLPHGMPRLMISEDHLRRALECLVDNAFKFTPQGGRVEIRVAQQGEWLQIAVEDTGIGIAPEDLQLLANPFYQLDGSTSRRFGGLGLGLTVVQKVAATYHGQLEISSTVGQGSCFTLKFPALRDAAVAQPVEMPAAKQYRILIVDDEEFVGMTLQEGLEKLPNCEIAVATSGAQALALFEEQPFDLLITDYRMPDMNGVTLALRVRERYPHTNVIMITAYSNYLLQEPLAAAAVQRVLNKPVRLAEIRAAALATLQADPSAEEPEEGRHED